MCKPGFMLLTTTTTTTTRCLLLCSVESALLLLPLAARVHERFSRVSGPAAPLPVGIMSLVNSAACLWKSYMKPVSEMQQRLTQSEAGRRAVADAAAEPLWRLHSAAVRLVHHAASEDGARLRGLHSHLRDWR